MKHGALKHGALKRGHDAFKLRPRFFVQVMRLGKRPSLTWLELEPLGSWQNLGITFPRWPEYRLVNVYEHNPLNARFNFILAANGEHDLLQGPLGDVPLRCIEAVVDRR